MNDEKTNNRLSPVRSIVVYTDKRQSSFYLESRDITNQGGKFHLSAAVPLSDSAMKNIAQAYMKNNAFNMTHASIIPGHMLHGSNKLGRTVVIWYRPAMRKTLNFSASIGIKGDKPVMVPATLNVIINTKLYIYALATDERPEANTKLYNAPYFNIYEDGNVCLGTANTGRVKKKTFEEEAERFERAFYMAEQNGGVAQQCKSSLNTIWTSLIKSQKPFPQKELVQHKKYKTLHDLMNKLIGQNQNEDEDDYDYDNQADPEFED